MRTIKTLRRLGLALLFLLALHLTARWLGLALYSAVQREAGRNADTADYCSYYFSQTKPNSVETVFIGSSHQYCSVDVNLLNREYGQNSILLASSSQSLTLSYYAALAAIELQHPKTIVLEMVYAEHPDLVEPHAPRLLLDNLPNWSRAKLRAAEDLQDAAWLHYYPLGAMHNNWYLLRPEDFLLPRRLADGERFVIKNRLSAPQEPWDLIAPEEKAPMAESTQARMEAFVRLCEDNGVELILYTAPQLATTQAQAIFNGLNDFAQEHGLRYRNMIYDLDAIGLDLQRDFADGGHLNCSGQEKLTRFLAETLLTG